MSNEEKLLKLLQIAVENGWKPVYYFQDLFTPCNYPCKCKILIYNDYEGFNVFFKPEWDISHDAVKYSLNDLVTNWEVGEVSFIQALCITCQPIVASYYYKHKEFRCREDNLIYSLDYEELEKEWYWDSMRNKRRYTSERLEWLFDTFSYLLN